MTEIARFLWIAKGKGGIEVLGKCDVFADHACIPLSGWSKYFLFLHAKLPVPSCSVIHNYLFWMTLNQIASLVSSCFLCLLHMFVSFLLLIILFQGPLLFQTLVNTNSVWNMVSVKGKCNGKVVESYLVPDNLNLMYILPDGQSKGLSYKIKVVLS